LLNIPICLRTALPPLAPDYVRRIFFHFHDSFGHFLNNTDKLAIINLIIMYEIIV